MTLLSINVPRRTLPSSLNNKCKFFLARVLAHNA